MDVACVPPDCNFNMLSLIALPRHVLQIGDGAEQSKPDLLDEVDGGGPSAPYHQTRFQVLRPEHGGVLFIWLTACPSCNLDD
jgi:hypothetical protein